MLSGRLRQESHTERRILLQPKLQQAQAELEQAQVATVGAMHETPPMVRCQPTLGHCRRIVRLRLVIH